MSRTLDECQLKVVRAEKHLNELSAEVERFFKGEPYTLFDERNPDDPGDIRIRLRVNDEPSPYLGAILGDFLQNCRSVLDYIQTALDTAAGRPKARNYFPVCEDPQDFENAATGYLSRLDANHVTLMKSVQPFEWTYGSPAEHPGAILHRLNRVDKHRSITPAVMNPKTIQIAFVYDDGRHSLQTCPTPFDLKMKDGAQVAHVRIPEGPYTKVDVKPSASFYLEFTGDDGDVIPFQAVTKRIFNWTRDEVLARFAPVLRQMP